MKKQILLLLFAFFGCMVIHAQETLMVHQNTKRLYLEHTVSPKENYYSIGRLYSVPPKDLASFNNLDMNSGLQVGQKLQIPLASYNFSQRSSTGQPVYYQVAESEGLYRVSVNNNNVSLDNLRKWNNLDGDNIHVGANLVIDYLSTREVLTATPANTVKEPPLENVTKKETTIAPPVKEIAKEVEPPKKETPKTPVENPKPAQTQTAPVNTSTVAATGYFTDAYQQQTKKFPVKKQATVSSGIFKTASGWQDGKYYILIDNVEPGMIVKVTNPSNSRFVYAKVLGAMSSIRQNQGYNIRMSNAAASVLGFEDEKFNVTVNY